MKFLSHIQLFAIPWTVAYQVAPSMEFSRQEYWSGLPFPSLGDLPDSGVKPRLLNWQVDSYHWATQEAQGIHIDICEFQEYGDEAVNKPGTQILL